MTSNIQHMTLSQPRLSIIIPLDFYKNKHIIPLDFYENMHIIPLDFCKTITLLIKFQM